MPTAHLYTQWTAGMTAKKPPGQVWGNLRARLSAVGSTPPGQDRSGRIRPELGSRSERVTVGSVAGGQVAEPFPDLAEVVWLEAGGAEPVELGDVEAADDGVQGGDAVAGGKGGLQTGRRRH